MAEALCARQIDCMASVATEYGREVMRQQEHLVIREGRMGEPEMEELMRTGTFLAVVDATHPYAVEVTEHIRAAAEAAGLPVTAVSTVTGFPEILGGRVKTLHPKIHAGILANKDDPFHMQTLAEKGIRPFDLVCVNLYDFAGAVERHLSLEEAVEEIDIGGPCMLRAAAKNFHSVLVLPSPQWYGAAMDELRQHDMNVSLNFRQVMASRAFEATSRYDALITSYLRP